MIRKLITKITINLVKLSIKETSRSKWMNNTNNNEKPQVKEKEEEEEEEEEKEEEL